MAGENAQKVLRCPSCGAGIPLRAIGHSLLVACQACGATMDPNNENLVVLNKIKNYAMLEPIIPLGRRGQLNGQLWEVIGFMRRCDGSGMYCWQEYLLFNPSRGFRWLTEFDGHWNYVVTTKEAPKMTSVAFGNYGKESARYSNKSYALFHKGIAEVKYVIGEFYWMVSVGETAAVEDYISPPEILSREDVKGETTWSVGQYVEPARIAEAFKIDSILMPSRIGVAPNQPALASASSREVQSYWGLFVGILIAVQLIFSVAAKNELVLKKDLVFNPDAIEKTVVSEPFQLKGGLRNIEIEVYSPVQNNWLEVHADLNNKDTGEDFEIEQGVEYYSGYDSDGSWTEGSQKDSKVASAIPGGTYTAVIEPSAPMGIRGAGYSVAIRRDVPTWKNFLWALFFISIIPLISWWRIRSFEQERWSASDYSPYWSMEIEDE